MPSTTYWTNPIYAGAYAFGRTRSQVSVVEGRKHIRRGVRRAIAEWDVLLKDQHEGYITWDEFEHNQRLLPAWTDDCQRRGTPRRSASRGTPALRSLRRKLDASKNLAESRVF